MKRLMGLVLAAGLCLPLMATAQDQTLADIRQELTILYVDIQTLKTELSTTGLASGASATGTPLERLIAIEAELQRLTGKIEELEFRVNRITSDGTNRIGDLEFRLCELEEGCDIGTLGDTPTLGGVDNGATVPVANPATGTGGPDLAIGERTDFDRAEAALAAGDFRSAAEQFEIFVLTYPGSPLSGQAHYLRGEAFESLDEMTNAARAYLDAFTVSSDGPLAPDALFKLGVSLGAIGQTQDACVTLAEVAVRFPGNPAIADADDAMRNLGCS